MSPEKWQQIKGQILDQFKDAEVISGALEDSDNGECETVTFVGPLGKMKLEYITRPVVIDKRTHGSRRIGSYTDVEYIYSDTEFSHSLRAYKWDEAQDDWLEIDMKSGIFSI